MSRILGIWSLAVLGCLLAMAAWGVIATAFTGRWEHAAHNIPDVAVAFTSVFAVSALAFIPMFLVFERVYRLSGMNAALVAALLGAGAYLAVGMVFGESEDPQTLWGWVSYWANHPARFVAGAAPFVFAGSLFGALWTRIRPMR